MFALKKASLFLRRTGNGCYRSVTVGSRSLTRRCGGAFLATWSWARARHWAYLAQGLPALAALIAVIVLAGLYLALPTQEVAARYQDRARAASKARDFPTALVCYERLAVLGNDRPENLYEMAVALEAQGQPERAREIMNQLAPADQVGYGLAHQWQALQHWKEIGDPRQRKLAETHLKAALQAGVPDEDATHGLLGELYAQSRRPNLAEAHLERAVRSRPHVRLRYAQVLAAQGKKARAMDEAKLAANFFKTRAAADIHDKFARIAWADCVTFIEDFPQALAILADGHHLTSDSVYKAAMARVVMTWHFFVVRTAPDDVATQWNLLERGLQLDGTNVQLLDRLVQLLGHGAADTEKARALMNKVLVQGEATATTHFLLGMDAYQRGDQAQAEVHWERAFRLAPNMPVVANNLAWLLAHAKNGDPVRALALIDRVLEKFPDEPGYRDTRAHVYMKLTRWRDALADLELVQRRDPAFPTLHESLAEVYAQLGIADLAAAHRRLADARAKKAKAANN